jgi:peptidoglycan/LPS O-acetylase OafA/YrhL
MNTLFLLLMVMLVPLFLLSRVRPGGRWHGAYLPTLDGWRAIACMLVVVDHTARGIGLGDRSGFLHGQHGVNIFFGLSGLLITTKIIEEREQSGTISLLNFYRRRVFRLFPAAFLFLAVVAVLASLGYVFVNTIDFTACVLYFRNFCDSPGSLVTAHFWSLAIEEQFYLVVPAMFLLLGTRRFQWFAAGGIAVSAFSRWLFFYKHPGYSYLLALRTDMRVDGLLAGCLMATVLNDGRARAWLKRVLTLPIWFALATGCVWWIHRHGEFTTVLESLLLPVLLAGTVLLCETWLGRILEWKPLGLLGRASYSVYLWQQLFAFHTSANSTLSSLQRFPLNIVAIFTFAAASYCIVERPLLKWSAQDRQLAFGLRFPEFLFAPGRKRA